MKKLLLFSAVLSVLSLSAQTTVWTEDFENSCTGGCTADGVNTGNGAWTITDSSPALDGCGFPTSPNTFYVSCAENGNAAGMCGTGCGNDESLHVGSTTVGDLGASYDSGGWCDFGLGGFGDGTETDVFVESPTIDLSGFTSNTIEFVYMEAGDGANDDASLWYFDGSTWSLLDALAKTSPCGAQGTWTAFTIALPASADNNANVKVAFKWVNNDDATGSDPSFAVDDIIITSPAVATNTITTGMNIQPTEWCEGNVITVQVDFTSTGTFNAGNVYTAEMSDAAGSFAAPTVIGTLNSVANSGMIVGVIPGSMPAGNGYRIRVVSDNPATIGTDNTIDLVIHPLPTVTMTPLADVCVNDPAFTLTAGSPVGGTYAGTGVATNMFDPAAAGVGTHTITYIYSDANGCSNDAQETITVNSCGVANTITTSTNIQPTEWCVGSPITIQVDFTSTGTFNAGNVYSAEISDALGSFAAPIVIGTLNSTANTGTIVSIVPGSMPAGTGYRIRVVSDNPATIGTDNTIDLVINPLPTVTMTSFADVCVYDAFFTLTGGSPAGGTYAGPGVTVNVFDPTAAGLGTHSITYTFTDGSGCSGTTQETITVDACSGLDENQQTNFVISPNPTDESFVITTSEKIEKVQLLDMSGRILKEFDEQPSYNVSDVPQGVYIVKLFGLTTQAVERIMIK